MIWKIVLILYSVSVLFLNNALTHPGGHGGGPELVATCSDSKICTKSEITEAAIKVYSYLNETYRLPVDWKSVTKSSWTKKKVFENQLYWITAFENPDAVEEKNKRLYIVITGDGFLSGVTDNISKFGDMESYDWIYGLALILIFSIIGFVIIRKFE